MGRYKSSDRMKFGLPLATAESKQVFHCYATHGKAYGRAIPNFAADVRIVVINAARQAHWDDATFDPYKRFQCAVLSDPRDWRLLGWAMADGSLPFGELEPVDPLLAQFNFLQGFNIPPHQQPHGPPHISGCDTSSRRP
jgi:hypothetical protein